MNVTTLDKFVQAHSIIRMDVLKIDTEGNDALVLLGAIKTLAFMRPSYVTFEHHRIGHWAKHDLKDTIDLLDGLSYTCYWATKHAKLYRITSCWDDSFNKKHWSNVACYSRFNTYLKGVMEKYVA